MEVVDAVVLGVRDRAGDNAGVDAGSACGSGCGPACASGPLLFLFLPLREDNDEDND